jgi:hypothetical protein
LLLGLLMLPLAVPALAAWPTRVIAPLAAYAGIVLAVPALRRSVTWLRAGRTDLRMALAAAAVSLVSAAALGAWYLLLRPDLGEFPRLIPRTSPVGLALFGVSFAVLNAVIEEATWRGVLMDALAVRVGWTAAVVLQGVLFGVAHANGIPSGAVGLVMASAYGIMLGALRLKTGGLLLCCAAHFFADLTIFALALTARG